ncbi:MAG: hypothetical protein ACRC46_03035 [Thermoguttaceae bacterium]
MKTTSTSQLTTFGVTTTWVRQLVAAGVLAAIPAGLAVAAETASPPTTAVPAAMPSAMPLVAVNQDRVPKSDRVVVKPETAKPETAKPETTTPETAKSEDATAETPTPPAPTRKSGGWVGVSSKGGEEIKIDEKQPQETTPTTTSKSQQWRKKEVAADPTKPTPPAVTETVPVKPATPVTPPAAQDEAADSETTEDDATKDAAADSLAPTPLPLPADSEAVTEEEPAGEASTPSTESTPSAAELVTEEPAEEPEVEDSGLLIDGQRVGDPYSATKIQMLYDEVMGGIQSRGITGRYSSWVNYARSVIRNTAGTNTGSELDGRFRNGWYRDMYNEPIKSVIEVDQFSREFHDAMSGNHLQLVAGMEMIRKKLDCRARGDSEGQLPEVTTPMEAVQAVVRALTEAQAGYTQALSTLNRDEQNRLSAELYDTFAKSAVSGHTIPNRSQGRQLVDIMSRVDRTGFCRSAEAIARLTDSALLEQLANLPDDAFPRVSVGGQQYQRLTTSVGDILIGGTENKIIDLDGHDMRDVVCVISRGGNDVYREGTVNFARPLFVVIDLAGDDVYSGSRPAIQGGAIMGVSAIIDAAGSNTYTAGDVAQGSAICGVGLLFDLDSDGKTKYKAFRRVQGHALAGIGVALDRGGDDTYRAALWAQGFGAPGGFGLLENVKGNDWYYCGGQFLDSYPEHPGYDGWGQGIGAGIRQVANGGIGVILDGSGDDLYEVDYFGQGGGYWMGLGFARDFGGNDKRMGSTLLAYDGNPRTQEKWTRFSNGWGCHYSLGYLFDDGGDDLFGGKIMGGGMAWDLSMGYLLSLGGNDTFAATGGMTQGVGAEGSIGILLSYGGNDNFMGRNQGNASSSITYHSPSNCGGNFSFVVNYGGEDTYGSKVPNNSYAQRGSSGGFLIDRPFHDEYDLFIASQAKMLADAKTKLDADVQTLEASKEGKTPQIQRSIQMQIAKLQQNYQKISATPQRPTIGAVTRLGAQREQAATKPATSPAASPDKTASPATRPTTK